MEDRERLYVRSVIHQLVAVLLLRLLLLLLLLEMVLLQVLLLRQRWDEAKEEGKRSRG